MKENKAIQPFYFSIAGFTIQINSRDAEWPFFREKYFKEAAIYHYRGFLVPSASVTKPDFTIDVHYDNRFDTIINGKEQKHFINIYQEVGENHIKTFTHIGLEQFALILREACQKLFSTANAAFIHTAALEFKQGAILFMGPSGAGKSTITQLLSNQGQVLTDDAGILKKENGKFMLYQSPAIEKNVMIEKSSLPTKINKLCFLTQSTLNKLTEITSVSQIEDLLLSQAYSETADVNSQLPLFLELAQQPQMFYELAFNLTDPEALALLLQ